MPATLSTATTTSATCLSPPGVRPARGNLTAVQGRVVYDTLLERSSHGKLPETKRLEARSSYVKPLLTQDNTKARRCFWQMLHVSVVTPRRMRISTGKLACTSSRLQKLARQSAQARTASGDLL
ncbi:hypothetical protein H257_02958 [Aphanomyces astaci]|uniref:Uncharacterized protein n=1 Tax=Aphanomyces astaci TaxID=112090 RepID=W4GZF6_APHAT|nr:hypothetical protein H257_02958 [Aphanomyces astaci]ETV85100.1 hypothetical protein H257_02958 [Aphanomyces astaci]|eukprot:XP_009825118.1 hypothetical protein H257_02958 [Aphanomyces astaci]